MSRWIIPLSMRIFQSVGAGQGDGEGVWNGEAVQAVKPLLQGIAVDVFHGDVVLALGFVHRVSGDDIEVFQMEHDVAFPLQPLDQFLVVGNMGKQHLERNDSIKADLACLPHHAHGSFAELTQKLEIAKNGQFFFRILPPSLNGGVLRRDFLPRRGSSASKYTRGAKGINLRLRFLTILWYRR